MTASSDPNQDQIAYWNSSAGKKWLAAQEHTDVMLAPVSQVLLTAAAPQQGAAVLDIGCGCGATTVELAEAVGSQGRIFAIDVSEPMLGRARERLSAYPHVELALADASVYAFQSFADLAISRFGVMFFADPTAAFANVIRALKPGGQLVFACWRKLEENPWMQVPLHAAYNAGVPRVERPGPEDPGPFSFADPERVTRILSGAGFQIPRFTKADVRLDVAAGGGLPAAVHQSLTIGATSRALQDQPDDLRKAATDAVEEALRPYLKDRTVYLPAAIWLVESARP
jgi:SAM-dependent methyltransferase